MSDQFSSKEESAIVEIQIRAANLRVQKVKAEKEFLDLLGTEISPEEMAAIQKKRLAILYQLELEGAEIEKEFVEKYRAKLAGLMVRYPGWGRWGGGLEGTQGCPFCTQCVTSCTECVTSCTACVGCSNNVF
jgi:hypothetical protein